ncbi:MAG: Smr/MutS family protein [Myxococcota bacterium]
MSSCLQHLEWRGLCEHLDQRLASPLARRSSAAPGSNDSDPEASAGASPEASPGTSPATASWARSNDPAVVRRWLSEQDGLEAAQQWRTELNVGAELMRVEALGDPIQHAARGATLEPAELWAVGQLADALGRLAPLLSPPDPVVLDLASEDTKAGHRALLDALPGLVAQPELAAILTRSIALEGPQGEPVVADAASPALARARSQVRSARQSLVRGAERLVRRPALSDALADKFWTEREGRVVLPVRSSGFSRVGGQGTVKGIIHGASTSGHTLYVEPSELVDDNNRLREAQMAARAEERRVLADLSARVGAVAPALTEGLDALARLDRIRARLRLGEALAGHRPDVVSTDHKGAALSLPAARHPLMVLAGTQVVPNDLRVPVGGGLIISGPNAGGKTVALKTLGLCVLMTQAGLRLPTEAPGVVPLFGRVITDVGDDQSITANLSTFSAHIGHVIEALQSAAEDPSGTLVLLDEVAVGTDPEQGAALAEAILRRLSGCGASVVVTTHYERLKLLATHGPPGAFVNAAVGFDLENLRPTFELRLGIPGSSSAIAVARRLGVDERVLTEAEAMLSDERLRVDVLLQALEAERIALVREREQVQAQQRELGAAAARLEAREQRAEQQAQSARGRAHEAAAQQLRELEDEIRRRRKQLRKAPLIAAPDGQVAPADADARDFARKAREAVSRGRVPAAPAPGSVPQLPEVGDRVFVETLGAEGKVLAVKGDKITVQLPRAKTTVDRSALRARAAGPRAAPRPTPVTPPSQVAQYFGADARPVPLRLDNAVDLRGQRADEALAMLEVFLDRALADDQEAVIVRHGHGSGALRRAVREHLPRLRHVRVHRPGLPPEGGDAVTVVWIEG